jgi:phage terminase large subunit-like protein
MLVKAAGSRHPIEWWMTGGRIGQIVKATDALSTAIRDRKITHDGAYVMTKHFINAKRNVTTQGVTIRKDYPDSPRKIDAAVAGILAHWARVQAVSAGLANRRTRTRRAYGF